MQVLVVMLVVLGGASNAAVAHPSQQCLLTAEHPLAIPAAR
jgi:hypothetical protein